MKLVPTNKFFQIYCFCFFWIHDFDAIWRQNLLRNVKSHDSSDCVTPDIFRL